MLVFFREYSWKPKINSNIYFILITFFFFWNIKLRVQIVSSKSVDFWIFYYLLWRKLWVCLFCVKSKYSNRSTASLTSHGDNAKSEFVFISMIHNFYFLSNVNCKDDDEIHLKKRRETAEKSLIDFFYSSNFSLFFWSNKKSQE